MNKKKIAIVLILILAIFFARFVFLAMKSEQLAPQVGTKEEKLTYCPQKPNCVSSQEEGDHYVEPIKSDLSLEEVKKRVLKLPRARLEKEGEKYLRFTFKSALFGFLDDVELLREDGLYHIRSASRVGYSDMGANRERVEIIRELISEKAKLKED